MRLQDFRVGWRLLLREPVWSVIVIAGLAIGFAVCFLLVSFVRYSRSYDVHVPGHERIYLVKTRFHFPGIREQWTSEAPLPLREVALQGGLAAAVTMFAPLETSMRVGASVTALPVTLVDPSFRAVFRVEALMGNLDAVLERPDTLALTEESATRLFGSRNVIGKTVTIRGTSYTIAAVVATPPPTSTAQFQALAGSGSNLWQSDDRNDALQNWGRLFGRVYVRLDAAADPASLVTALQNASNRSPLHRQLPPEFFAQLGNRNLMDVSLVNLEDVYLDPDLEATAKPAEHGNRAALWGLGATGALILVLAGVNYVNLATTRTLRRRREIGVRKALGADAGQIGAQFVSESVLAAALAIACGLLLAWLILPVFASVMNRTLTGLFTPAACLAAISLSLVLGCAAGVYPAWVAARVRATAALAGRGNVESVSGLWVRRALTVTQFAVAIGLSAVTLAIAWQTWHSARLDPGFDANSLLVIDMAPPFTPSTPRTRAFAAAVARLPGVAGAAQSMEAVGRTVVIQKSTAKRDGEAMITLEKKGVGVGYFTVYGIRTLAGRGFMEDRDGDLSSGEIPKVIVLSATAARALGFASPSEAIGRSIELDGTLGTGGLREVIGVVPDIRHQSLQEAPLPVIYTLSGSTPVLSVRVSGEMAQVQAQIEGLWRNFFPDTALQMSRAQTFLAARYADDLRLAKLLASATVIAIAISAFGTYVLSAYIVQRLFLQIVMRKLHGAGKFAIFRLVSRELSVLLLVSALVALPIAYVAIRWYLAGFVEPAQVGGWPLLFALITCAVVAIAAAWRHIWEAMRVAPTEALRT